MRLRPRNAQKKTIGQICSLDDECAPGYCYIDEDGDRYAPTSGTKKCQANSQLAGIDCYDLNANAYPGQTQCYGTHRGDGSFDYNCNGQVDMRCNRVTTLPADYSCKSTVPLGSTGWVSRVPVCGAWGTLRGCDHWMAVGCTSEAGWQGGCSECIVSTPPFYGWTITDNGAWNCCY